MKYSGRLYQGRDKAYLAIYTFWPDMFAFTPPSLPSARRIAHASYTKKGGPKGMDVFEVNPEEVRRANDIKLSETKFTPSTDEAHDLAYHIHYQLLNGTNPEVQQLIRGDIDEFCKDKVSRKKGTTSTEYVDSIVARTEARRIPQDHLIVPGKQEFVPSCVLDRNLDFGKGCLAGWIPGDNASFDGKTFTNFYHFPAGECEYCYAIPKHKSFPKTLFEINKEQLKRELLGDCLLKTGAKEKLGRPVEILRLGKRTEVGSEFTLDELRTTLETCIETKTTPVMPTKFLKFHSDIAELLKRTNTTLLYSIGFDEVEKGPQKYGCDNNFRLEQAALYREAGVKSELYLLMHAHIPPSERDKRFLQFADKHNLPIQLLPLRFMSKDFAMRMTGVEWSLLKDKNAHVFPTPHEAVRGTYYSSSRSLIPEIINEEWQEMIGQRNNGEITMCHHTEEKSWCGGCGVRPGFVANEKKPEIISLTVKGKKAKKLQPHEDLFHNIDKKKD